MKYLKIIVPVLFVNLGLLNGCGLFQKKPLREDEKSIQQIMQEQHEMNKKLDSLKQIRVDKEIDSLRIVLDSSSKNLNETMQKILKSDEMNKNNGQKTK